MAFALKKLLQVKSFSSLPLQLIGGLFLWYYWEQTFTYREFPDISLPSCCHDHDLWVLLVCITDIHVPRSKRKIFSFKSTDPSSGKEEGCSHYGSYFLFFFLFHNFNHISNCLHLISTTFVLKLSLLFFFWKPGFVILEKKKQAFSLNFYFIALCFAWKTVAWGQKVTSMWENDGANYRNSHFRSKF